MAWLSGARSFPHLGTTTALLFAAGIQAATFFLVARSLGVAAFGQFMIFSAVTQFAVEMVGLGSGDAMIRRVTRSRTEFPRALGNGLVLLVLTVIPVGTVTLTLLLGISEVAWLALAIFVAGELVGVRLSALCEHACMAVNQVQFANYVRLLTATMRLVVAATAFVLVGGVELEDWLKLQGVATLLISAAAMLLVANRWGRPQLCIVREDLGFGALTSLNLLASTAQSTLDRFVLGIVSTTAVVGLYSAATRALQLALIPVQAILRNLYARFFEAGAGGINATLTFARSNAAPVLYVGLLMSVLIAVGADLFAKMLGPEFGDVGPLLRSLCLIPAARGAQSILGDVLSTTGHQSTRTTINLCGIAIFLATLYLLAGRFGHWGAIGAVYLHQAVVVSSLGVAIWRLRASTFQNGRTNCP